MEASELLPIVFGAGGAAFLAACAQAWRSWRDSAEVRESKAIRNLERWSGECWEDLAHERRMGAHWYRICGILEYHIHRHGLEMPVLPDPPADTRKES